jgi:hypothetical protein
LQKINSLYKEYDSVRRYSETIISQSNGVGGFGHDVKGTYEMRVGYGFYNSKGEDVYSFNIYYWDYQNFGVIKHFEIREYTEEDKKYLFDHVPKSN